ncbi:MAG TPA: quinoprotein dehydrogenase-associated putative ABC transporter substrate-binding protein [Rhodanobacteraceae bacterium]|nr:quinoprotein dehydrogenase-associated putative ABC transporter substrate-binding protein [Rhodanobacteraceae bacterium]
MNRPARHLAPLAVAALLCAPLPALAQSAPAHALVPPVPPHVQTAGAAPAPANAPLRVCADPNDLPFSNRAGEGFENKLADMLAKAMGKTVDYTWRARRRHFLRDTLHARRCDVVMALPTRDTDALTTAPYYRSSYALVYRANAPYKINSLEDPRLRTLQIGVHAVGDDWVDLPGGAVLAHRGIVRNVHIYKLYADYGRASPSADLIEAVANGDVDVAIAWGPLAGYFATRQKTPLVVVPLEHTHAILPFEFSISLAVRHGDTALRDKLNAILAEKHDAIHALLARYGVPQLALKATAGGSEKVAVERETTGDSTGSGMR